MSFGFHIHNVVATIDHCSNLNRVFGTLQYIGLLCILLFLQPGFGVVGLEAVDEDTEAVVTVSPDGLSMFFSA